MRVSTLFATVSSTRNASPGCGVSRLGQHLSRRRAFRLGVTDSIASGAMVYETGLNPEVVQTESVR